MISGGAGQLGNGGSLGTPNRNEWVVLKGAACDEPATPTRYIPVAALGLDVHNNFNDIFWTYVQKILKPSTASDGA